MLAPAAPRATALPAWLVPLGATVGLPFNGARSNLALAPGVSGRVLRELRAFGPDVVHLHEPVAPWPCWSALTSDDAPLVGTFHTYGTSRLTHGLAALCGSQARMRRLAVRIAVSEAAAWTGRSFYGGEYRVIPNGIDLGAAASGARLDASRRAGPRLGGPRRAPDVLRVVFVGRPEARKGLPVLHRAFDSLAGEVAATLELVGVRSAATEAEKAAALARADVLVAPSLGGESFGMVLLEAFAAGLPVVASDIPGYRDVARRDVDGLLVPPGDPAALAEALRALALDPERRARLAAAASERAATFAWPQVAAQVEQAYADARTAPAPAPHAVQRRAAPGPRGLSARRLPAPLPPLEPHPPRRVRVARAARAGAAVAGAAAVVAGTVAALHHVGVDALVTAVARSSPGWTGAAVAVMALSLALRAVAWRSLLAAALPARGVGLRDAYRATAIGVLMSATLPARLGEPARALLATRRLGGRRGDVLPAVLGTMVAQTALNVLALLVLAAVLLTGAGPWEGRGAVLVGVVGPIAALAAAIAAAPALYRGAARRGLRDAARPRSAGVVGPIDRRGSSDAPRRAAAGVVRLADRALGSADRARAGLAALGHPRHGPVAAVAQLVAWALQWLACWALLAALGIAAGPGAAAGVLLAVNVSAIVPLTPSNVGVFQAACVAVLTAFGVPAQDALAYGVVLQAVELATAVVLGVPALLREGVTWREVRQDALRGVPVRMRPLERT